MLNPTNDRVHGELLRKWRESQKIDVCTLALNANLSVAQIRQLESGGASLFYTASIKESAARKVATLLGGDPGAVVLPAGDVASEKGPSVVDELIELSRPQARWTKWGPLVLPRPGWVASILLFWWLLAAIGWMEHTAPGQSEPPAGQPSMMMSFNASAAAQPVAQTPPQSTTNPTQLPSETRSAAAVATAIESPLADGDSAAVVASVPPANTAHASLCQQAPQSPAGTVLEPSQGRKAGNMVHFVALKDGVACAVDGAGQRTVFSLKANESRTVHGTPPWRVHFEMPEQAQVFFQGLRLRMPDPSITAVVLREGPHGL